MREGIYDVKEVEWERNEGGMLVMKRVECERNERGKM